MLSNSVTVTSLDGLSSESSPWATQKTEESEEEESSDDEEEDKEEVPGMSLKKEEETVEKQLVDPREKKNINKTAIKQLQGSKVFKAKERLKAKKNRRESKFGRKTNKKKPFFPNKCAQY